MKKFLCVLLALVMLIGTAPAVFATGAGEPPLRIDITTDKTSYGTFGVADVTVTITNTSNETIENINAQATLDRLTRTKGSTEASKSSLSSGESFSYSYKVMLGNGNNLNFLQRIWLNILRIFRSIFAGKDSTTNIDTGRDFVQEAKSIKFGKVSGTNTVKVWFGGVVMLSDETIEQVQNIIQIIDDKYKDILSINGYSEETRQSLYEFLQTLEIERKIFNLSVEESNPNFFTFEYGSGILGGYLIEGVPEDEKPLTWSPNRTLTIGNTALNSFFNNDFTETLDSESIIGNNNVIVLTSLNQSSVEMLYAYESVKDRFRSSSHNFNLKEKYNATVADFYDLYNYGVILIASHGINYHGLPSITLEEKAIFDNMKRYSDDIFQKRLAIVGGGMIFPSGGKYYILPKFFNDNYDENKLPDSFVHMSCCQGYSNNELVSALYSAGAKAVLGYTDTVCVEYDGAIMLETIDSLLRGRTTEISRLTAINNLGESDPCNTNTYYQLYGDEKLKLFRKPYNVPADATEFNGHYYKAINHSYGGDIFGQSQSHCEELGGHLVTITSQEEQHFIETLLTETETTKKYYIIGAQNQNGWKWITGEPWYYSNLGYIMGNGPIAIDRNDNTWKWSSLLVSMGNHGFICEWEGKT